MTFATRNNNAYSANLPIFFHSLPAAFFELDSQKVPSRSLAESGKIFSRAIAISHLKKNVLKGKRNEWEFKGESLAMLMKKWSVVVAGSAIALATNWGFPNSALAQNFQEIYVFGDSLSDVGKAYQTSQGEIPPSPPYFRGRYSNGPIWVEHLASQLNLTFNPDTDFAVGGATTGDSKATPPGLLTQIENFTATHTSANPNALYIVWAGANDYLGGATDTTTTINNLSRSVQALSTFGAKNIVVVNLPDLGKLPGTIASPKADVLHNLTVEHNSQLASYVTNFNQQLNADNSIIYVDVNSLFDRAINEPAKFGFKNVTQACLSQGSRCANPNEYLFWDDIHPTTAAHKLLVDLTVSRLKSVSGSSSISASNYALPLGAVMLGALGAGLILKRKKEVKGRV